MRRFGSIPALLLWLGFAVVAEAQELQLLLPDGPQYAGTEIEIQLLATGFEEDPEPEVEAPSIPGMTLQAAGVTPQVRSEIRIVNGSVSRTKEVSFRFHYRARAEVAGRYSLGPFRAQQGAAVRTAEARSLEIRGVPARANMAISIDVPEGPFYPGQRVPVTLEWTFGSDLRERMNGYALRVPAFEDHEAYRIVDPERSEEEASIVLQTAEGPSEVPAEVLSEKRGGRLFRRVRMQRNLIPLRPGPVRIAPARVIVDEATSWSRDFFGGRTPRAIRKWSAEDRERVLDVREVPREGRPESYGGAVGQGFQIEVQADRSVVQTGDPIELTITLRGGGLLESAQLPPLSADGGPAPPLFRLPSNQATGETVGRMVDGGKVFRAQIRALDPVVREIPALAFSYFDPERESFETVRSRPIALSVRAASVVTAGDVVAAPDDPGEVAQVPRPEDTLARTDLRGVDFAIETDVERLLTTAHADRRPTLEVGLYAGGTLALFGAFLLRRRTRVPLEESERRRRLKAERTRIAGARTGSRREVMADVGSAIRSMLRERPGFEHPDLDPLLAECDAASFAPASEGDEPLAGDFPSRALALADALLQAETQP